MDFSGCRIFHFMGVPTVICFRKPLWGTVFCHYKKHLGTWLGRYILGFVLKSHSINGYLHFQLTLNKAFFFSDTYFAHLKMEF